MVLAMIRDLPSHSRWSAWFHDPDRGDEFRERFKLDQNIGDEEGQHKVNWYEDARIWNTDRILQAFIANRLVDLLKYSVQWERGKSPKFETLGPASWRSEEPQQEQQTPTSESRYESILSAFGYVGPELGAAPPQDPGP